MGSECGGRERWHRKTGGSGKEVKWRRVMVFSSSFSPAEEGCVFLIQWRMQQCVPDSEMNDSTFCTVGLWLFSKRPLNDWGSWPWIRPWAWGLEGGLGLIARLPTLHDAWQTNERCNGFLGDSVCVRLTQTPTSSATHWTEIRGGLSREGW